MAETGRLLGLREPQYLKEAVVRLLSRIDLIQAKVSHQTAMQRKSTA
jgi:hypothetical protein